MKLRALLVLFALVTFTIAACDEGTEEEVEDDNIESNIDEERDMDEEFGDTPVEGTVPEIQENEDIIPIMNDMTFDVTNIAEEGDEWVITIDFEYTGEEDINPFEVGAQELVLVDSEENEYPPIESDISAGEVRFNAPEGDGPYELVLPGQEPVQLDIE